MLVLVDPFEFEVVVAPGLGVAPSHRISGFQQAVAGVAVSGFNLFGMFGFKLAWRVFVPDEVGKLGSRGSRIKMADIADCSDDAGRSRPYQCLEMEAKAYRIVSNCCLMVIFKTLTCSFNARMATIEPAMAGLQYRSQSWACVRPSLLTSNPHPIRFPLR